MQGPGHPRRTPARLPFPGVLVILALGLAAAAAPDRPRVGLYAETGAPGAMPAITGVRNGCRRGEMDLLERAVPAERAEATGVLAELALESVDVLVTVGPRAATDARDTRRATATVFTGVMRPEALGLPGRATLCGTAGGVSAEDLVAAIRRAAPWVRRLVVVMTRDDAEDEALLEALSVTPAAAGLTIATDAISQADALKDAALVLAESVPGARANRVVRRLEGKRVLLVGTRRAHLDAGAALVVRTDPKALGATAADLVRRIVNGEAPEQIGVVRPRRVLFELNLTAARRLGVEIPLSAIAGADHVVPDFGGRR